MRLLCDEGSDCASVTEGSVVTDVEGEEVGGTRLGGGGFGGGVWVGKDWVGWVGAVMLVVGARNSEG